MMRKVMVVITFETDAMDDMVENIAADMRYQTETLEENGWAVRNPRVRGLEQGGIMRWTMEDELDWAENCVRLREEKSEMRRGFDIAIEWTFIAIAIWSVVEAAKILVSINS